MTRSVALAALLWLVAVPAAQADTTAAVGGLRDPAAGVLELSVVAGSSASLRSASASLDGQELDTAPFAGDGCEPEACPHGTAELQVPTTGFPDGEHRLVIAVTASDGVVVVHDKPITVANTMPAYQSTVTLTIGSSTGVPGVVPGGGAGGGGGGQPVACQWPRLSIRAPGRALARRRDEIVVRAGRRYRFSGRLTCLIGKRRVPAPRGTVVVLRVRAHGVLLGQEVLNVGRDGRFAEFRRLRAWRVLVFRFRGPSGELLKVRIPVRVVHR